MNDQPESPLGRYGSIEAPPPPTTPPAPDTHSSLGRAGAALIAAGAAAAALVGMGIGSQVRLHGSRPTLSATAIAPSGAATTPPDGSPLDPTNPRSGTASPTPRSSGNGVTSSAIAANVDAAIVDINTKLGYQNVAGAGTGMVLTSSGEVLTNNHVVDGATSISVSLVKGGRTYKATIVGTDPTEDIAILQLQGASGLTTIRTGDSSATAVGDPVVAIGNAGGVGGTPSVVTGNVQAVNQTITASDQGGANSETLTGLLQFNAPIQPGDSGGPLVNAAGQVIGMNTAASASRRFTSTGTVAFAIPIAHALTIAHEIESGQASATVHLGVRGFLGVAVDGGGQGALNGGLGGSNAVVTGVLPGSPASNAGIAAGDTITSIDGQAVDSASSLSTLTKRHRPGDRITVVWTDQAGNSHSATVTLAVGPAD